jgi:uncharacterized protein YndB with AHSA1/START domain
MVSVTRYAAAPVDRVFEVVSDPTTYPDWLVGAKAIRSVDDHWPQAGSEFHHRVGLIGPLTVADSTTSLDVDAPRFLALEVRARPLIKARVEFRLAEVTPERTRVTMDETVIGQFSPLAPVLEPGIEARNRASLNALVAKLNEPASF